ncbi:major latex protein 146-like isoform X2 [Andrographis paniculata]|uniref:major latex protein 146-like isoform X2 n=1 Tax=Andrographis paniculata TaxID=175694 RepID=UPI0021E98EFF|nr:major latex protein 146-like isoform X2 [Andrographis paniculata]
MASNQIESVDITSSVKASPDKFYNFFKFEINDLLKIVPTVFIGVKLLEGEEGKVGCVKQWNYILGAIPMSAKLKLTALDDTAKTITFSVLEGDLLVLYKSFVASLEFTEGFAKCTFTYEKSTLLSPPPEAYVVIVKSIFMLLDAYLLLV